MPRRCSRLWPSGAAARSSRRTRDRSEHSRRLERAAGGCDWACDLLLSPYPIHRAFVLGPGARRQPQPAESGFILEEQRQAVIQIAPANHAAGLAGGSLDTFIRGSQGDKYLTPFGPPPGHTLVVE